MEGGGEAEAEQEMKHVYSVWAIPPEDVRERLKKLMEGLRSEFGGPEFEPHITVVGAIKLTESDALHKFRSACESLKSSSSSYTASVNAVSTGTFFYQCVYLLLHPSTEGYIMFFRPLEKHLAFFHVVETSAHCTGHFGFKSSTPYMPHLSLIYGDLTEEDKQRAKEKAEILDGTVNSLNFDVASVALYETDTEDKSLKSWKKV